MLIFKVRSRSRETVEPCSCAKCQAIEASIKSLSEGETVVFHFFEEAKPRTGLHWFSVAIGFVWGVVAASIILDILKFN